MTRYNFTSLEGRERSCAQCGSPFTRDNRLSNAQWAARRYCSQACTGLALKAQYSRDRQPLREKFQSFFATGDGCWEWRGTIEGYGYGVIDHARRRYRAHVLALEFDGRPVPKGMCACHHCDNPRCVRPDHLYVGTAQDNANDAMRRGLLQKGERHHQAKLTEAKIREIRSLDLSYTEVARLYGISRPTAARIMKGVAWRHVQ